MKTRVTNLDANGLGRLIADLEKCCITVEDLVSGPSIRIKRIGGSTRYEVALDDLLVEKLRRFWVEKDLNERYR
jgi:hypothetical protein